MEWKAESPIYRQMTDIVIARILNGTYNDGDLLPSGRHLADEFDVSSLTGAKVVREVESLGLTSKKRGIGFQLNPGARHKLLDMERTKFLQEEWPGIAKRLALLDIDIAKLPKPKKGVVSEK
ncbi:MAG: GntR family transcriptional regulator [Pseudomonadota bacterium]